MNPEYKERIIRPTKDKIGLLGRVVLAASTFFGAQAMPPLNAHAEASRSPDHTIAYSVQEQLSLEDQVFIAEADKKFSVDDIGLRISNPYIGPDGLKYIAYQGAIIQKNPKLGTVIWNAMDELPKIVPGIDAYLEAIYQIPPHEDFDDKSGGDTEKAFEIRIRYYGIPQDMADFLRGKRQKFETGVPTSHVKDYGPFVAIRTQRYPLMKWKETGLIQRILTGDIVKNVGRRIDGKEIPGPKIIPDEALLAQPVARLGAGGGPELPNTVDVLLAVKTDRVDYVETKTSTGQTVSVETKVTPTSQFKAILNEGTKSQLAQVVAKDAQKNGFSEIKLVVLESRPNVSAVDLGLPKEAGGVLKTWINRGAYDGSGRDNGVYIGYFATSRDNSGRVILFYIPATYLDLNDSIIRRAVNEAITMTLLEMSFSGGDLSASLFGQTEHIALRDQQAVTLTK